LPDSAAKKWLSASVCSKKWCFLPANSAPILNNPAPKSAAKSFFLLFSSFFLLFVRLCQKKYVYICFRAESAPTDFINSPFLSKKKKKKRKRKKRKEKEKKKRKRKKEKEGKKGKQPF